MDPKAFYLSRPWTKFFREGQPTTADVPNATVADLFDQAVEEFPGKAAIIFYGRKVTYRQLGESVDKLATALADMGIKPGDKVALFLLNSPQFVISYFAVLKAGATVTAISPVYTSHEIKHQLTDSDAKALICQDMLYEKVEKSGVELQNVIVTSVAEYLPRFKQIIGRSILGKLFRKLKISTPIKTLAPNMVWFQDLLKNTVANPPKVQLDPATAIAALPYTGGTTGNPKGAILTHRNLVSAQQISSNFFSDLERGNEYIMAFLPFFHIYGQLVVMFTSITNGWTLLLYTTPDLEDILTSMEVYNVGAFYGVPTLYERLKDFKNTDRVNWKKVKYIICGADSLHEATVKDWDARTGTVISEGYGLTESSSISNLNPPERPKKGSFGIPGTNMGAAVVDPDTLEFVAVGEVGELILSGPHIMGGYWQNQKASDDVFMDVDGETWLRTGDLVRMDEDGYFFFFDRQKDLIKFKGYSVFAKDIEDVLYQHPRVKEAGVIGVPDPAVGHNIKAIVVLQPEARGQVNEEEIKAYCAEHLAHYKVPKIVEFRGELPKTDVGKISRRELRDD